MLDAGVGRWHPDPVVPHAKLPRPMTWLMSAAAGAKIPLYVKIEAGFTLHYAWLRIVWFERAAGVGAFPWNII
jgi:hypothetical protein